MGNPKFATLKPIERRSREQPGASLRHVDRLHALHPSPNVCIKGWLLQMHRSHVQKLYCCIGERPGAPKSPIPIGRICGSSRQCRHLVMLFRLLCMWNGPAKMTNVFRKLLLSDRAIQSIHSFNGQLLPWRKMFESGENPRSL
jgi:hypothetical protein